MRIQVWFKNRRAKCRQQQSQQLKGEESSTTTDSKSSVRTTSSSSSTSSKKSKSHQGQQQQQQHQHSGLSTLEDRHSPVASTNNINSGTPKREDTSPQSTSCLPSPSPGQGLLGHQHQPPQHQQQQHLTMGQLPYTSSTITQAGMTSSLSSATSLTGQVDAFGGTVSDSIIGNGTGVTGQQLSSFWTPIGSGLNSGGVGTAANPTVDYGASNRSSTLVMQVRASSLSPHGIGRQVCSPAVF